MSRAKNRNITITMLEKSIKTTILMVGLEREREKERERERERERGHNNEEEPS